MHAHTPRKRTQSKIRTISITKSNKPIDTRVSFSAMQKVNVSDEFGAIVKVHNNNSKANLDGINIRKNNIEIRVPMESIMPSRARQEYTH